MSAPLPGERAEVWLRRGWLALAAAGLSLATTLTILGPGVWTTPDSWAYLEGSVSLLAGRGYSFFGGQPIRMFPPGFSLYLAGILAPLGVSGWSLGVAVALAAAGTVGVWTQVFVSACRPGRGSVPAMILAAAFFWAFVSASFRVLHSEVLSMAFLGGTLWVVVLGNPWASDRSKRSVAAWVTATATLVLALLLTRNANVALLPALWVAALLGARSSQRTRAGWLTAITLASACALWLAIRSSLGQQQSHALQLGGRYLPLEYAVQMLRGLPDVLALPRPAWLRWPSFLAVLAALAAAPQLAKRRGGERASSDLAQIAVITAITLMLQFALFNVTSVADRLDGRFLWFAGAALGGGVAVAASWASHRLLRIALYGLLVLLIAGQGARVVYHVRSSLAGEWEPRLRAEHTLSPDHFSRPSEIRGALTLISPPDPAWIDRDYKGSEIAPESNRSPRP